MVSRMITLKDYIKSVTEAIDTKQGNYVSVGAKFPRGIDQFIPTDESKSNDAHVTLMYSKETHLNNDSVSQAVIQKFGNTFDATILKGSILGHEKDVGCIVLILHSPTLEKIHTYLKSIGLQHSYPSYHPHLTLAYDVKIDDANAMIDQINKSDLIGKKITLHSVTATTIIKDWNK